MIERARLTIQSIAAGGDGVARHEGLVVFVPRAAPGDVVDASFELRGRLARGSVDTLVVPSPLRVSPPCPHYTRDRCGGCQLQHVAVDAQRAIKARIITDAFARIGRRSVDEPTVAAGEPWRYRRKLTLALRRSGDRWIAGLHPYDAPGRIFALDDCPITDERVVAVWREVLGATHWLPRVPALRGSVRLLDDGAAFVLEGGERWTTAEAFANAASSLREIWWRPDRGPRRLVIARDERARAGASFVQVNPQMAAAMLEHVVTRLLAHAPATAIDAFAGVGDTAVRLAAAGVQTTAIELDTDAAAVAADRLPAGSCALAGRVEALLPPRLPADVVVLNPPRGGIDPAVAVALDASPPRAVVYVSCDPATLARDVARLPSMRIRALAAFDMFPQTAHVETVCELVPEDA